MVKISVDSQVPFARNLVYSTYRDKVLELGPHLPNVRSLQLQSREETDQQVHLKLEWYGGGDIPAAVRTLLSEDLFIWTEYDVWNNHEFAVEWRIETHAYREAVFCTGKNYFRDQGDRTLVESRAEVRIDLSAIHGMPPFLRDRLGPRVEGLVAKKIEPNLLQMGQHVQQYLEQTQKR